MQVGEGDEDTRRKTKSNETTNKNIKWSHIGREETNTSTTSSDQSTIIGKGIFFSFHFFYHEIFQGM